MADVGRLDRIVRNLTRAIPDPPPPIARPTGSFAGLKVGQRLRENFGILEVNVVAVDSLGAFVSTGTRLDRNWKATWTRVRAPRKAKP